MKKELLVKTFALDIVVLLIGAGVVSAFNVDYVNEPKPISGDINKISKNEIMYRDRDQDFDIIVTNPFDGNFSVLLGDGNGGFSYIYSYQLKIQTSGIVAGDFGLDGFLDIAITNLNHASISVLKGDGNGYFTECMDYDVGNDPFFITTGDYNLDGFLDLVISNTYDDDISLLLNDGNGHFFESHRFPTGNGPFHLIAGDFNNDDLLDLATVNFYDDTVSILIGDGDGGFLPQLTYPTGYKPAYLTTGDFNNDNALDLAITNNYDSDFSILLNNGSAGFNNRQDFFVGTYPMAIVTDDFNDDNALDIALTYGHPIEDKYVDIFLGDNTGGFQLYTAYDIGDVGWDVITADFNGDDALDLAISVPDRENICVLNGDGTGHFSDYKNYYAGFCCFYMAFGNLNSNNPPDSPIITGQRKGKTGTTYDFTFNSTDLDSDDIAEYIINWGDNTSLENISGPFASGEGISVNHTWNASGKYTILSKAIDIKGGESNWSEFKVTMPRNRASYYSSLFLRFLEQFPNVFAILRYFVGGR